MSRVDDFKQLIKENTDDESVLCNYEICKSCKEKRGLTCCQTCPCELSPTDLKEVTKENILKLLDTGYVTIDSWDGDLTFAGYDEYKHVYYLRARSREDQGPVEFGFGGCCSLLVDAEGCLLDFKHRPYYGRTMPVCGSNSNLDPELSSKQRSCLEWRPYHDLLEEVIRELVKLNVEISAFTLFNIFHLL